MSSSGSEASSSPPARVEQLVHRAPEVGELLLAATSYATSYAPLAPQCFGLVLREVAIVYAPGDTRQRERQLFCRAAALVVAVVVLPDRTKKPFARF